MKKCFLRLFAIIIVVCMLICGCNDVPENAVSVPDAESKAPAEKLPVSSPDSVAVTDFAVNLFKASGKDGENTLISPLSVLIALSMTANGAENDTLIQMENVLGMPVNELNDFIKTYSASLPQGEKYKLNLANSIWFKDGFPVNDEFLQINESYYGAGVYQKPFDDSTVKEINDWVNEKTEEMIPEILKEIPEDVIMYLINALAFEAEWAEKYSEYSVGEGTFTKEDGTVQTIEMMRSMEGKYISDENAEGFIKYYKDGKYAFAVLLPKEGMRVADYLKTLEGDTLNNTLSSPQNLSVYAGLPKFETEFDEEMSDILKSMGMTDAFDRDVADFSGISTEKGKNIFISRVLHKTFISVAEEGTKAGAVTAVEMTDESAPHIDKTIILDRPFVYMLIDCETNIPFFMGTLMSIDEVPETEITEHTFEAQYIRADGYHDEFEYPIVKVIRSVEDLNAHYEEYKDYFLLDGGGLGNPPTFKEACEKYDDEFFNKKLLILVLLEEGSGSIHHEVKSVKTSGSNVEIDIEVNIPEVCTDDMAEWHIMIEVDKDSGIEKGDNIKVNLS